MSPGAQLAITAQAHCALESRTPPVKNVGKPCAGEPQARFDGRGLETERRPWSKRKLPRGNSRQKRQDLQPNTRPRVSPRPSQFVIDPPMPLVHIARVHSGPVVSAESRNRCRDAAISASASDRPTHSAPSTLLPGSRSL
jgi:hypothetical protein